MGSSSNPSLHVLCFSMMAAEAIETVDMSSSEDDNSYDSTSTSNGRSSDESAAVLSREIAECSHRSNIEEEVIYLYRKNLSEWSTTEVDEDKRWNIHPYSACECAGKRTSVSRGGVVCFSRKAIL